MNSIKFEKKIHFFAPVEVFLHSFQNRSNTRASDLHRSTSESPNQQENVLSLSIHVESVENLTNVFWVIFSVFEFEKFKKSAISRRLKDVPKILVSNLSL